MKYLVLILYLWQYFRLAVRSYPDLNMVFNCLLLRLRPLLPLLPLIFDASVLMLIILMFYMNSDLCICLMTEWCNGQVFLLLTADVVVNILVTVESLINNLWLLHSYWFFSSIISEILSNVITNLKCGASWHLEC